MAEAEGQTHVQEKRTKRKSQGIYYTPSFVTKYIVQQTVGHYLEECGYDASKGEWVDMVKSGITGWAQVNGYRGDTSIEERTRYDLWYIENWSLLLDFKIMFKTGMAMLRGDNAY